jgi:hypothetical protein
MTDLIGCPWCGENFTQTELDVHIHLCREKGEKTLLQIMHEETREPNPAHLNKVQIITNHLHKRIWLWWPAKTPDRVIGKIARRIQKLENKGYARIFMGSKPGPSSAQSWVCEGCGIKSLNYHWVQGYTLCRECAMETEVNE